MASGPTYVTLNSALSYRSSDGQVSYWDGREGVGGTLFGIYAWGVDLLLQSTGLAPKEMSVADTLEMLGDRAKDVSAVLEERRIILSQNTRDEPLKDSSVPNHPADKVLVWSDRELFDRLLEFQRLLTPDMTLIHLVDDGLFAAMTKESLTQAEGSPKTVLVVLSTGSWYDSLSVIRMLSNFRVAIVPLEIAGGSIRIGPSGVPGMSGCLECYWAWKIGEMSIQPIPGEDQPSAYLRQIGFGLALEECARAVKADQPVPSYLSRVLEIDRTSMVPKVTVVHEHPSCVACGTAHDLAKRKT